ncbi:MAG: hypothetical protein M3296_02080, partial [Actinomycetota bacterium]|nr:hypothetical protein [Actinomycetota bacterium]
PWAQHAYVGRRASSGTQPAPVDAAEAGDLEVVHAVDHALRARGCPKRIWITETGTFDHRCAGMAAALGGWAHDPRVDAAFQYTFREDSSYPVGLADPALREAYGAYRAWRAFAGPSGPPHRPCA